MFRVYLKNGESLTIEAKIYQTERIGENTFFNFFDSEDKPITDIWLTAADVACVVPVSYLVKDER